MTFRHAGPTDERWAVLDFGQQILMIARELHRAGKLTAPEHRDRRRRSLERVYALLDLTIAANASSSTRRELLRWREQLSLSYLETSVSPAHDREMLRVLLRLSPASALQIPDVAR